MALIELDVDSTAGIVDAVLGISGGVTDGRPLWFRGLSCAEHTLLPKLYREAADHASAIDRERRLAVRFRQRSLPYWPSGYPQNDWEHLFVMQHHGVPTRLLDWTENLFIGLYFALPSGQAHGVDDAHPDGSCTPALWVLDPVGWNATVPQLEGLIDHGSIYTTADEEIVRPYLPATNENKMLQRNDQPLAIFGTHNSSRIVAQRGTFTIAGRSLNPLETFATTTEPVLWQIRIRTGGDELKRHLGVLGFTESMIFPDLGALARELEQSEV